MKHDILKQFASLHKALHGERAAIQARLHQLNATLGGGRTASGDEFPTPFTRKKRGMTAAGRAAIVAAQKARWAKYNAEKGATPKKANKSKRTMSPEAKAKIAAAQRKRWAKFHAAKGK